MRLMSQKSSGTWGQEGIVHLTWGREKEDSTEKAVLKPGAGRGFLWAEGGEGQTQSQECAGCV